MKQSHLERDCQALGARNGNAKDSGAFVLVQYLYQFYSKFNAKNLKPWQSQILT